MRALTQLKRDAKRGVSRVRHALWPCVQRPGVRCLVYHSIVSGARDDPEQMTTPASLFEEQMGFLASNGYHVEEAASVVEQLRGGEPLTPKTVVLTFDDGFADTASHALPVLQKYRFPVTCFVTTAALDGRFEQLHHQWPGEYLTWDRARALRASGLVQFGCHSATHRNLRGLPATILDEEVAGAKRRLEEGLGSPVRLFAYPFGSYRAWDRSSRAAVEDAGFLAAFTSVAGFNTEQDDRFLLRRCRVSWCEEIPEFDRLLYGAYDWYAMVQRLQALRAP